MDKVSTNGPAWIMPQYKNRIADNIYEQITEGGLTQREYFSALFMQANLSNPEAMEYLTKDYGGSVEESLRLVAAKSVKLADYLIEELNK